MAISIEGNTTIGFRVIDEDLGALTGRKRTEKDAYAAAGIDPKPRGRAAKQTANEPTETADAPSDES